MFYLGPYYSNHSEHHKYAQLFWGSLSQSVYLSLQNLHTFDPTRHYCFGTNRHFTEVTHDEIEDIRFAMLAAREAFLQSGLRHTSLSASEFDLRAVLGRINYHHGSMYAPFGMNEVVQTVLEEIQKGNLIFVPLNEDLRVCVKAIQEDRQRQAASRQSSRPDRFDSGAAARQMYRKPPRVPQNLDAPLYSSSAGSFGDAQPFEYQPHVPDGEIFNLAKTPNDGEPGSWYTNSGSGQMRLYGNSGQPAVDFDFDHDHGQGIPHAHNWSIDPLTGKNSRGPGVPFSILP
jgi:hypothetical protein